MDSETAPPPAGANTPPRHRLLFFGKVLPGFDETAVREALARHLQRAPAELFSGKRVVVSDELDFIEAETAREALEALGARVQLETVEAPPPMAPLSFLDLTVPPPPKDGGSPSPASGSALTDSGWQALNQALEPLPEGDAAPLELDAAALAARVAAGSLYPAGSFTAESPALAASLPPRSPASALSRPPTDLSAVYGSHNAPAPAVDAASPVFAPVAKAPLPPHSPAASPSSSFLAGPSIGDVAMVDALPAAADGDAEVLRVVCPNCHEWQPMRVMCRACNSELKLALAAQQESRELARAKRARLIGAPQRPGPDGKASPDDDALRILGFQVSDEFADRLTLANGLLALFGLLLVLSAVGLVWRMVRPEPVLSSSPRVAVKPAAAAAAASGAAPGVSGADSGPASSTGSAPTEAEVASRLGGPAAVGEFRQVYWPKAAPKVFVAGGGAAWAWRAGMPSVTRAVSEALGECDSRRPPDAPECKVVNVDNFWQE